MVEACIHNREIKLMCVWAFITVEKERDQQLLLLLNLVARQACFCTSDLVQVTVHSCTNLPFTIIQDHPLHLFSCKLHHYFLLLPLSGPLAALPFLSLSLAPLNFLSSWTHTCTSVHSVDSTHTPTHTQPSPPSTSHSASSMSIFTTTVSSGVRRSSSSRKRVMLMEDCGWEREWKWDGDEIHNL